jgi:uncharacterized membrane protein
MSIQSTLARERVLAGTILLLVFVAGALAGGAVVRWMDHPVEPPPDAVAFRGPRPGGMRGRGPGGAALDPGLAARLELDSAQQDAIARIFDEHRKRSDELLGRVQPELVAELDQARSEIRKLLNPSQQQAFDQWMTDGRSLMAGRFGMSRGGRSGPPMRP